jgi:hypothetical protein
MNGTETRRCDVDFCVLWQWWKGVVHELLRFVRKHDWAQIEDLGHGKG